MLKQIRLTMKPPAGQKPNVFWAYNLYGALMQKIDPHYADFLHTTGFKPINQYIYTKKNDENIYWTVNLIGKEAAEAFLDILMNTNSVTLEHHQTELQVVGREMTKEASEMELVQKYLLEDEAKASVTISTLTPCAFRSNDSYVIIPSPGLIINSAVQKWNAFATEVAISDEEAVRQIIDATKITAYKLKSFQYHFKGVKIPSFYGDVTLSMRGPEPMLRLFNLLMHYLEFSGLGIKCSLGMGGVNITERRKKTNV
jgi:CRISPR-associated endoribonuclease Cas6